MSDKRRHAGGAKQGGRTPKVTVMDGNGFAHNTQRAFVVLHISRREIEQCLVASAYDRLLVMIDSKENMLRYRESVVFQVFGYDADPRELYEMPEVRAYFDKLTDMWPHWLWFLARGNQFVGTLMALLCECVAVRQGSRLGTQFLSPTELNTKFNQLWGRSVPLFSAYEIPEQLQSEVLRRAVADLQGR